MQRISSPGFKPVKRSLASFTLVELLVVIAIIATLVGLTLMAAQGLQAQSARNRAKTEIQAMGVVLENYKVDNGTYPQTSSLTGPPNGSYPLDPDPKAGAVEYETASQVLYSSLTGYQRFTDPPVSGTRSYTTFKKTQVGNATTGSGLSYLQDPWGYPYGYSTGDTKNPQVQYPYTGSGLYDLWLTGNTTGITTANKNPTNTWIANWTQQ